MLVELTVKEFLDKVAGSDPVSGGGSTAVLNDVVTSALTTMVAGLIVGKKGYEEHEELMKHISRLSIGQQESFVEYTDRDSEAYDRVFGCSKLPRTMDEEKAAQSATIQEAACFAVSIPMQVTRNACELTEVVAGVARLGNQNAITDACVAMMAARLAVLGALPNVRINLASLKNTAFVGELKWEVCRLKQLACTREKELLKVVDQELNQ